MILMIDNYDSFTYNLVQYLGELGQEVEVKRNDQISIADIELMRPAQIVLSPGPCTPNEAGVSLQVVKSFAGKIPILGVCLGHQCIGQAYGGDVVRAKAIMHGKISSVQHNSTGLFAGINGPFQATRYHSLVIDSQSLPECFEVTAWTAKDNDLDEIMAIAHRSLPLVGVQFHPESIMTEHGHRLLENFLTATSDYHRGGR